MLSDKPKIFFLTVRLFRQEDRLLAAWLRRDAIASYNDAASVKSEKSVIQKKKSDNPWHLRENNIKLQIVSPTDSTDAHGCGCAGGGHGFLRSHGCCVRRTAEKANIGGYGVSP